MYDNCVGVPKCSKKGPSKGHWGIEGESVGLRRKEKSSQVAKWEQEELGGQECRHAWKPLEGEQHAR